MNTVRIDVMRVLRVGGAVAQRLQTAPCDAGQVHSVFDRVVNVIWQDGRLLTLQAPGPLVAPFAAELDRLPDWHRLTPGAPVWRTTSALELGDLTIHTDTAVTAETAMPHASRSACARAVLTAAALRTAASALSSSIGVDGRARLAAGIARRRPDLFVAGARRLLGLGEGLTPAGDDCLVGALAVLQCYASAWMGAHPEIRATLDTAAVTATTTIAAEFVRRALDGHFAEAVVDVLTAASEADARQAVAKLRGAGATSGADTLCGMRLALTALGNSKS